MKRTMMVYTLNLDEGGAIAVQANNAVEAFDKIRLLFPREAEGHTYEDLEEREGWKI